jgi:hypothetical protein
MLFRRKLLRELLLYNVFVGENLFFYLNELNIYDALVFKNVFLPNYS